MDDRGREKQIPVYTGPLYAMEGKSGQLRRERILQLTAGILCAVLLVIYLQLGTPSTRIIYVLPVALCALIPTAYWVIGAVSCFRCPVSGMNNVHKENGPGRVLRSCTAVWIILAMSLLGDIILCLSQSVLSAEWPGLALLLCAFGTAFAEFTRARERYHRIRITDPGREKPPKPGRRSHMQK